MRKPEPPPPLRESQLEALFGAVPKPNPFRDAQQPPSPPAPVAPPAPPVPPPSKPTLPRAALSRSLRETVVVVALLLSGLLWLLSLTGGLWRLDGLR